MNEAPLRRFIETVSDLTDAQFTGAAPMPARIYAIAAEGLPAIFEAVFANSDDEVEFRVGVPARLREAGFLAWVFVCEAWNAPYDGSGPLPADRPDRMEIVLFAGETRDSPTPIMASRQIHRDGASARLLPLVFSPRPGFFAVAPRSPAEAAAAAAERPAGPPS